MVGVLCLTYSVKAQPDYNNLSPDEQYSLARDKALNGDHRGARELCYLILLKIPDYLDVQLLMGRLYGWDKQYDSARIYIQAALRIHETYLDAHLAATDLEYWDEQYEKSVQFANRGLQIYPNQKDLLTKRAKALMALKRYDEAMFSLTQLEALDPGCLECRNMRRLAKSKMYKYIAGAYVGMDRFSVNFKPMYYSNLQLTTKTPLGGLNLRLNQAYRFDKNGYQPEIDFYPGLWKSAYAYVNYAFSGSSLFPNHRIGFEVYQTLPNAFEVSGGIRYLNFKTEPDVMIYTGYLGWYLQDYWFSVRAFSTPLSGDLSNSINLSARKYFEHAFNYVGFTLGAGYSPDQRRLPTNDGLSTNNIYYLQSQRVEINFQHMFNQTYIWGIDATYMHQELSLSTGSSLYILGFSTNLRIRL